MEEKTRVLIIHGIGGTGKTQATLPPTPIVDNDGKVSNPELQAQEQGLKED
jgi:hypothetical protein